MRFRRITDKVQLYFKLSGKNVAVFKVMRGDRLFAYDPDCIDRKFRNRQTS